MVSTDNITYRSTPQVVERVRAVMAHQAQQALPAAAPCLN